jgi:hypothetical protein
MFHDTNPSIAEGLKLLEKTKGQKPRETFPFKFGWTDANYR